MTGEWNRSEFRNERGSCRKRSDLEQYLRGCRCAQRQQGPRPLQIDPDRKHPIR